VFPLENKWHLVLRKNQVWDGDHENILNMNPLPSSDFFTQQALFHVLFFDVPASPVLQTHL
jgi:hypothetical protein